MDAVLITLLMSLTDSAYSSLCIQSTNLTEISCAEKRLKDKLLTGYDVDLRPVLDHSVPINVTIEFSFQAIINLNEKEETLSIAAWLRVYWSDAHLQWKPVEHHNITTMRLKAHKVWTPDLIVNNRAGGTSITTLGEQEYVMVKSSGDMVWLRPVLLNTLCNVDATYFPFDRQTCSVIVQSRAHTSEALLQHNPKFLIEAYLIYGESEEFKLDKYYATHHLFQFSCCKNPFSVVKFNMELKRYPYYFVFTIICPCILILFMSLFQFLIPPDSGERVSFVITLLLAFSVLQFVLVDNLPQSSLKLPLINEAIIIYMVISGVGVVFAIISVQTANKSRDHKTPPDWLMKLLFIKAAANQNDEADLKQCNEECTIATSKTQRDPEIWGMINSKINVILGIIYTVILLIGLIVTFARYQGQF